MSKKSESQKIPLFPKILLLGVIISALVVLPAVTALYMKFSDILAFKVIYLFSLFVTLMLQIVNTYMYSNVLLMPCMLMCAFIFGSAVAIVMFDKFQDKQESLMWSFIPLIIFFHIITMEITQTIIKKYLGQAVQKINQLTLNVPPVGHAHTSLGYFKDANDPSLKPKK